MTYYNRGKEAKPVSENRSTQSSNNQQRSYSCSHGRDYIDVTNEAASGQSRNTTRVVVLA